MLSIKRLPALSPSRIQSNLHFQLKNGLIERQISKHYHSNLLSLCKSVSALHSLTRKSRHPQLQHFNAEFKAACSLLQRSDLPGLNLFHNNSNIRNLHTSSTYYNQNENKDKIQRNIGHHL
ncbi:jg25675 [Pararge aegeria aegeria]|uniref:Jg25675 protein n=1 Tax=Pararge aegeria aegeria TaxID=348720 RepID=A0A8S4QPG2_9NEOP|nr:jg25675 [Pararge aegeria aegeria]